MENSSSSNPTLAEAEKMNEVLKKSLLILNGALLALGNCGGPLIQRL
jgi:hypothetical protein